MKKNKLYKLSLVAALAVTFTSCLNDSLYDDGATQAVRSTGNDKFVEVHLTSSDNSNIITYSFDNSDADTTLNFVPIRLTSAAAASEDVTVTFDVLTTSSNDVVLDSLVNINGCIIPPTSGYTILNSNNTLTIPKGSREGFIRAKLKPSNFLGFNSVIAFKIASVTGGYTISNLSTGYVVFNVKNKYDMKYNCVGVFTHPVNGPRDIDEEKRLKTVNSNTNQISVGDLGGDYTVNITVDPITNDVTFSGGSPYNILPQATRSYYEPSTGKFYLHYYYVGGNGNRLIDETYTPE